MRQNLPVTQKEFDYDSHTTLMSVTDTQSHIAYANDAETLARALGTRHRLASGPVLSRPATGPAVR